MRRTEIGQPVRVDIPRSILPAPIVSYRGDDDWQLENDYFYCWGDTQIIVPKGFLFDLASIPRVIWALIAPFELSISAPLIHDWLYTNPAGQSREEVDKLFLAIMEEEAVPSWRRVPAYLAVRLFGGRFWTT